MTDAPRERPADAVVLHEFSGHIRARPRPIFDALAARFDPGESAQSQFTADAAAWLVIVQGGWWYRAEYRVVPNDTGSILEHALLNVSGSSKRIGRFSGLKIVESAPRDFAALLSSLRAELE